MLHFHNIVYFNTSINKNIIIDIHKHDIQFWAR